MSLPGFLDVAIGIAFMYLMLSLMCTVINEIIATFLKLRAKYLSTAIVKIIDDPTVRHAFYNHGLIAEAQIASGGAPSGEGKATGSKTDADGKPKDPGHPSYVDARNFAMALLDSLDPDTQKTRPAGKPYPTFEEIETLVGKMDDTAIRDVLVANLAVSKKELGALRDNVAGWFDTAMDRLSGDYKRASKTIAIIVGIALAAVINADTLTVGQALWSDDALRNQMVEAAKSVKPDTGCTDDDPAAKLTCLRTKFEANGAALHPLPLGWHWADLPEGDAGEKVLWWLLKLFGVVWTGLALSLGAPFWFDLLQKFMNIRGAGPKPAEKKKNASG